MLKKRKHTANISRRLEQELKCRFFVEMFLRLTIFDLRETILNFAYQIHQLSKKSSNTLKNNKSF